MIRAELSEIVGFEERHKRLLARLFLVFAATTVLDLSGTVLVYLFERHAPHTDIHSVWDALFFTTVQLLTVSSQIRNPLTAAGRIVDVALEIWAVIVVAGSAGAIASFFGDAPASSGQSGRSQTTPSGGKASSAE